MPNHPYNNPGWMRAATGHTKQEAQIKAKSKVNEAAARPLSVLKVRRTKKGGK